MVKNQKKQAKKTKKYTSRISLTLMLSLFVFGVLLAALALASLILFCLTWAGLLTDAAGELHMSTVVPLLLAVSLLLGWLGAFFGSRIPLRPINELIDKMNRLAAGDFRARLRFGPTLSSYRVFREISDSFNTMAEELENTEMLRMDFVNNLSHEFKTPIVSIAGFAKLLRQRELPREQQIEYLSAIEEESRRLSSMATNVLHLSRVENQTILTDKTRFNLAEQLRHAVLLLEDRWTKKEITPDLRLEECKIEASEELLSEVWINLIDNAVKFSPRRGRVSLSSKKEGRAITVTVQNESPAIPEGKLEKLFAKFYQADESHATQGNGIGLAIVKRVVELHGGRVTVACEGGEIAFSVTLPIA